MDEQAKPEPKILYEGRSIRRICNGVTHTVQLLEADKTWGQDHDVMPCDCTKEAA